MNIPKNYFHDRLVLLLISINTAITIFTTLLILFRLRGGNAAGLVGQYHANLGLKGFDKTGSISTYVSFIAFAVLVLVLHTALSMRTYHKRRDYSIGILWLGLFLLVLVLIVSNALAVLQ